ncbi:hypothetical protein PBRA_000387 [Plasmodiophora brassicae]|uniref:Uncharacterized protein n=1 Tax=Plasmodiophora brassicae TaxID=37360 RepID=A0A0G4IHQ3_PLABS|nr:hypothetical protein PBRA_000387 [Plasmodiophora brassicae]
MTEPGTWGQTPEVSFQGEIVLLSAHLVMKSEHLYVRSFHQTYRTDLAGEGRSYAGQTRQPGRGGDLM